jgi:hypothetical protein
MNRNEDDVITLGSIAEDTNGVGIGGDDTVGELKAAGLTDE